MRVAVVSPYYKEALGQLHRCHASVAGQTHPCRHIFVSDGQPRDLDSLGSDFDHILIPNSDDFGNTPRLIGGISAAARGFDAIAFLDGDNWYEPNHVETMVRLANSTGATVVSARRMLLTLEGDPMGVDTFDSDGNVFCDTNCVFLAREGLELIHGWWMPKDLAVVGDRVFWEQVLRSGQKRAVSDLPTVNYLTGWACHYEAFGRPVPATARRIIQTRNGRPLLVSGDLPKG